MGGGGGAWNGRSGSSSGSSQVGCGDSVACRLSKDVSHVASKAARMMHGINSC